MEKTVYDFQDYKKYLSHVVAIRSKQGRGFRSELAENVGVQLAFVYQVLSRSAHFNLEHGERINRFLRHDREESHYFLLLIQHARAGTTGLRKYFKEQMEETLNKRLFLKNRMRSDANITPEQRNRYYSAWYYGAIRVALGNPELRTKEALARKFKLSLSTVRDALEFLETCGLATRDEDTYRTGPQFMHLANDSSLILRHHMNWRLKALSSLERGRPNDLHFSSVWSLSEKDALELRAILATFMEDLQKRAKDSQDEVIYSFCVDYFEP